jgi:uncharacterized delta-60 repeat protein
MAILHPVSAKKSSFLFRFAQILCLVGIGLFFHSSAFGAAVTLDLTFGTDGVVATDIENGSRDEGMAVAVQQDGKIVVSGNFNQKFLLLRYKPNGSLDTTFDSDGMVTWPDTAAHGKAIVVKSDGKILVGGLLYGEETSDYGLFQFNSDGSLDASFGSSGIVTSDPLGSVDDGEAIAVQSDGKILLVGHSDIEISGIQYGKDFFMLRYNPDGTLDTTFGTGGFVREDFDYFDNGVSVGIQSDGKIVAAIHTSSYNYFLNSTVLLRYDADGSLDPSFGEGGTVTGAGLSCYDMAIQGDDKILVTGYLSGDEALWRYDEDGSLDSSFSGDGMAATDVGRAFTKSVVVQEDGKIVLAGYMGGDFLMLRYNADGSLDTTYGSEGVVITDIKGNSDSGYAATIQSDDKTLLTGTTFSGTSYDVALLRFNTSTVDQSGDVDGSGTVEIADAILLLKFLAGLEQEADLNHWADANLDDQLEAAEVIYVLQTVAEIR